MFDMLDTSRTQYLLPHDTSGGEDRGVFLRRSTFRRDVMGFYILVARGRELCQRLPDASPDILRDSVWYFKTRGDFPPMDVRRGLLSYRVERSCLDVSQHQRCKLSLFDFLYTL